MPRQLHNPPTLHPTPGFCHIAKATGSTLVFFGGQVAIDRDFKMVGEGDLRAQTVRAMQNLGVALEEAGGTWDDIVRRTVYTMHPTEYELIAEAIDEVTGGVADPPQTLIGVSGLAVPGLLIEIEATASIGERADDVGG